VTRGWRAGALAGLLLAAAGPARAEDRAPLGPHLAVTAGVTEIVDPQPRGLYAIAWQDRRGAYKASPWVFVEATTRDTFFGFGALLDLPVGSRCLVTPSLAGALYHDHDGLGLGSMVEFRSALDLTWRIRTGWIGASVLHYSNARISGDRNPGTEALLFVWATPIGRR
jgi:hypothetical protein